MSLAGQVDQVGAEAYWCHGAPSPFMAFHDPPPSVRCRHACPPRADASSAAGGGEPVSPEAAGALPRALRQAETAGSGDASHPRAALTPAGLALAPDGRQARHADPLASSGLAAVLAVEVAARTAADSEGLAATHRGMAQANPTWGEERIANELRLKLGLTVSPRTVGRYLRTLRPRRGGSAVPAVGDVCAESCARDRRL